MKTFKKQKFSKLICNRPISRIIIMTAAGCLVIMLSGRYTPVELPGFTDNTVTAPKEPDVLTGLNVLEDPALFCDRGQKGDKSHFAERTAQNWNCFFDKAALILSEYRGNADDSFEPSVLKYNLMRLTPEEEVFSIPAEGFTVRNLKSSLEALYKQFARQYDLPYRTKAQDTCGGQIFESLSRKDAEWTSSLYRWIQAEPSQAAVRLGLSASAVEGGYDPTNPKHVKEDPSTWLVPSWKNVTISIYNGDGASTELYSNAQAISSLASVYTYYTGWEDVEGFKTYADRLWEASHSAHVSIGEVYYCEGCVDPTAPSPENAIMAEEEALGAAAGILPQESADGQETASDASDRDEKITGPGQTTEQPSAAVETAPAAAQADGIGTLTGAAAAIGGNAAETAAGIPASQETAQAAGLQVLQGTAQAAGSSASQEATQAAGSSASQGTTQAAGSSVLQGTTQAAGSSVLQGTTQAAGSSASQEATQAAGSSVLQGTTQAAGSSASQEATQAAGNSASQEATQAAGNSASQGTTQEAAGPAGPADDIYRTSQNTAGQEIQGGAGTGESTGQEADTGLISPENSENGASAADDGAAGADAAMGEGIAADVPPVKSAELQLNEVGKFCPGHVDLTITARINGISERNNLFTLSAAEGSKKAESWPGWNSYTRAYARRLYSQDWAAAYGLSLTELALGKPLTSAEINGYMNALPVGISNERRTVIAYALNSVGKIPYYYGGKAKAPGYERNQFCVLTSPDRKGRILSGLDCSGWVNWVYWSVTGKAPTVYGTSGLARAGKPVSRENLQPGDIIVRLGADSHVMMFLGWTADGQMICVHETGGNTSNVTVSVTNVHWPYYRSLFAQ